MNIVEYLGTVHSIYLNGSQQQGVLCVDRNTLLLAVPGSGKTTVLVSRIANLIINHGVQSDNMLTLTYSKETARDMAARYHQLFHAISASKPEFRTIHSFCLMVMKHYASVMGRTLPHIISDNSTIRLKTQVLRQLYKKYNQEYLSDDLLETMERQIGYAKNMMLTNQQIDEVLVEIGHFSDIYSEYERYKKQHKLMDFDDMLTCTYDIFTRFPKILSTFQQKYHCINVDEAQDTSLIQHKIIEQLAENSSVFMVGDEDQSIYSFRGAYPQALLNFSEHYMEAAVIKMEQNFRSNSDIVSVANRFIKQNKQRYPKEMYCANTNSNSIDIVKLKDFAEQYVYILTYILNKKPNETVGVIYKYNESAIPLIDLFYQCDLKFYIKEHTQSYFTSSILRDLVSFFRLSFDPCDIESFRQIYFKLGISKSDFEQVKDRLHEYDNVFTCVLAVANLPNYKSEKLKFYRSALKRLANMKADKGIAYIMDAFDYQSYINNRLGDGFCRTSAYQKINTATCIAKGVDNITEYLDKLNVLHVSFIKKKNIDEGSNICLSTLHSSKGLEFDTVFLLDVIKDIIPSSDAVSDMLEGQFELIENETRLFYVGLTRAKTKLVLFQSRMQNGIVTLPSRYVGIVEKGGEGGIKQTTPL